jgi:hypothetical protein
MIHQCQRFGATAPDQEKKRWIPPAESFMKINVDAGIARDGELVWCCCCRDIRGMYMGASDVVYKDLTEVITFEAMACNAKRV